MQITAKQAHVAHNYHRRGDPDNYFFLASPSLNLSGKKHTPLLAKGFDIGSSFPNTLSDCTAFHVLNGWNVWNRWNGWNERLLSRHE
jgi:hypothetical protein